MITGALQYIPYYLAGEGKHWAVLGICLVPYFGVFMSVALGCMMPQYKFTWRLDYGFRTLKFDPANPNFEAHKNPQSNPADRK